MFDTYIAIDPSLWWNRYALLDDAKKAIPQLASARTLWVANSGEERGDAATKLEAIVRDAKNPKLHFVHAPFLDEKHATIYHPAALSAFRSLFAPAPHP
jgi:predicted alpha/beta superfamily hydrolase